MLKSFKKLICFGLIVVVMTVSFSYTYWKDVLQGGASNRFAIVDIKGGFTWGAGGGEVGEIDVPDFIPEWIRDKIEDWLSGTSGVQKDPAIVKEIAEKLEQIYQYEAFTDNVHVETALEDFFSNGSFNVGANDYIIYTVGVGADMEVIVVHTSSEFSFSSIDEFTHALNWLWQDGENLRVVTPLWVPGKSYTWAHAAVEYEGKFYYFQNTNDRSNNPSIARSTWFEITPDYRLVPDNIYPVGYFVSDGVRYFRSRQSIWNPNTIDTGWAFREVPQWTGSGSFSGGNVATRGTVYTIENGEPRFWEAMRATEGREPNEENCRQGFWREVENAWIGRGGDFGTPKTYYKTHNTYQSGDIAVFDIGPNLRYRFYQAIANVPHDEPPLLPQPNGQLGLNSAYWVRWE